VKVISSYATQEDMKKFTTQADSLNSELKIIENKNIVIDSSKTCDKCKRALISEEFIIFPCLHGFHKVSFSENKSQIKIGMSGEAD